jgi:hypothetical protein
MPKALPLLPLLLSSLFACGGGTPEASTPSAPAATAGPASTTAGPKADDTKAKQAAALDALTADEEKNGACDPDHKAALDSLVLDIEASAKTRTGDDGSPLGLAVMEKRVVPLASAPRSITMTVSGRGTELHVVAFSAREVSMDVMAGGAASTTMRSPHQRSLLAAPAKIELPKAGTVELESDSRQVQIKPGQPLEVRLRGRGCGALVVLQKR